MAFKLIASDSLTNQVKSFKIDTWEGLIKYIQSLSYGRTSNRYDISLVLSEKKGTCSSKHALLKQVADLNKIPNVKLILGMYKMNQENTPNIGNELSKNKIDYIPEAHCYLMINNERIDITTNNSEIKKIEKDIISEKEIQPSQVSEYKVNYHKEFLRNWITKSKTNFNFNEIWDIREKCIENLSKKQ